MKRYIIAFWMFLTISALCLSGLIWIVGDLFQVIALSTLFSLFFGSGWYFLGKYYREKALEQGKRETHTIPH